MNRRRFIVSTAVAVTAAGAAMSTLPLTTQAEVRPSTRVRSISAMTLAPDGKLIVADWRNGVLHALTLPTLAERKPTPFNVMDLSGRLAQAYALAPDSLRVTAAVLLAVSQTAIIAVALGRKADAPVGLALVNVEGQITPLDIDSLLGASQVLGGPPANAQIWGKVPARSLFVTDLKAHGSELIVAGLSNASFDSTLRRVPYPFSGAGSETGVEMYHTVHNQIETRAPVRTFSIIDVEGEPTLLAAYTCTPLVTVPLAELKGGAKVRGKTIAELGYGNTPLDMLPFTIEYGGKKIEMVMIANSSKSADLISLAEVAKAAKGEGLSKPVKPPFEQYAGVRAVPAPIVGAQRIMDQGGPYLGILRREADTGELQLVSYHKFAPFRLSDFINEYDFPSYTYPADDKFQQEYMRPFHQIMKTAENQAAFIK